MLCFTVPKTAPTKNIYTKKELVMTETSTYDFHKSFFIPEINKLAFHVPYVGILGTNHCGNKCREAFKCYGLFHYKICP